MLYTEEEMLGTELPMLPEKPENAMTHEEIIYAGEHLMNYEAVGFVRAYKDKFEKVYVRK